MKPVAILGVGPAGLMAAQACVMQGKIVALFSRGDMDTGPMKSKLGGAQFLHYPIPGINEVNKPDAEVRYILCGTSDVYRRKVYGDDPTIPFVSMEHLKHNEVQSAWNLQATYDTLWEQLVTGTTINVELINPAWIEKALDNNWFDTILSTVPAPSLCRSMVGAADAMGHMFMVQGVSIATECVLDNLPDNHIIYEGTEDRSWYRCSKLFGQGGTEWSGGLAVPYSNLVKVSKPIRTSCNCWEGKVIRLGRHGTWTKGVLTHHAFIGAYDALQ